MNVLCSEFTKGGPEKTVGFAAVVESIICKRVDTMSTTAFIPVSESQMVEPTLTRWPAGGAAQPQVCDGALGCYIPEDRRTHGLCSLISSTIVVDIKLYRGDESLRLRV